jgi:acetylornithine deacetylase/succinyl-diaminopimelate desuccinylase-like protein
MNRQMRRLGQQFKIRFRPDMATVMKCLEAQCPDYENGWASIIDESSDLGKKQAHYIRAESGRGFKEYSSENAAIEFPQMASLAPGLSVFIFAPGQKCFRNHLDREVQFFHGEREHVRPKDFNEDMTESAYAVVRSRERG